MNTLVLTPLVAALLFNLGGHIFLGSRDLYPPTLDDFVNSAAPPFGVMKVNVDITENDPPTMPGEAIAHYSTNGQASWSSVPLYEISGAIGGTWEASFLVTDSYAHYYFMVHDDSAASFSSPHNSGNAYPPGTNMTADPGDEPAGDAYAPHNNCVDLNGVRIGYSNDRLYVSLSNVTGSWPTSGGIFGPWFVYTAALDNPDAGRDDIGFALVYADVPILLSPGLYAIDAGDSTYTLIGNIDYTVQGGDLHLRCRLADLYAHPAFGTYNPSGHYLMGAGTGTADLSGGIFVNDMTNGYAFYHRTDIETVGLNTPPFLTDPGYSFVASPRDSAINFYVTYTDPDGHLAALRNLVLDDMPMEMPPGGPEHDYMAGVQFELGANLGPGQHTYYFSFGDGMATVETDVDTILIGTGVPEEPACGPVAIRSVWPQPCRTEAQISFSLRDAGQAHLDIFDISGRHVTRIWSGTAGDHSVVWDARDDSGVAVASGIYFARLSSAGGHDRAKIAFLR